MRAHKIATATMLVLAVSGWGVAGTGAAYADGPAHGGKAKSADKGPAHGGRAKARAEGGSATGAGFFQQNIAQSARQNNNCNNPNTEDEEISLTDSRAAGRCVTADGSLTAFSRIQGGPAHAQGGTSAATLAEQNIAQHGRQNNNCSNPNASPIEVDSSRVEGRCAGQDSSFSMHTFVKGGGARAEGGSGGGDVFQQSVAQEGRQNSNCNDPNADSDIDVSEGSRVAFRCGNRDRSLSKHVFVKSGGARAVGGSTAEAFADVEQQNIAQEGRQNNNCNNPNADTDVTVEGGGRVKGRCGNKDHSFSKHVFAKSGGARADGGSTTGVDSDVQQQNIAQEGRQNNNCNNPNNDSNVDVDEGGRLGARCGNKDHSFSKHTFAKSGGARADGGSSTGDGSDVEQQNIAQEGRQNNNCNNPNDSSDVTVDGGGRVKGRCGNMDHSFSKHTFAKSGGARTEGGSGTVATVEQQNIAQEGRQNNNCNNPNNDSDLDVRGGGRLRARCGNKDHSFSKHTFAKSGGARTEGGSSPSEVIQQNIAQEGRQNNNCHHPNADADLDVNEESRAVFRCGNKDSSFSKHTWIKGGGARAESGPADSTLITQNVAQEGRQNNNCNNPNNDSDLDVRGGGRLGARCGNKDSSYSKHTLIKGGGARTEGSSSTDEVFQQNTAQEGRQNNNCNNPNNSSDLDVTGGRMGVRCGNKDASFSKHTWVKGGGARTEIGSTDIVGQQNTAQEGRQNNNCTNPNTDSDITVTEGSRAAFRCGNKDSSYSKHTRIKGGGARVETPPTTATLEQQNTAQEGRQNNNCHNPNQTSLDLTGGRVGARCGNKDASFSKHTLIKGGGAHAEGGSADATLRGQNVAQEGRQNNNCTNPNNVSIDVTDSRVAARCGNKDASFSTHIRIRGGGARAEGGSSTDSDVFQQTIAQEGRQNNNCHNPNANLGDVDVSGDTRVVSRCGNKDFSFNRKTFLKNGSAHAEGGSTTGTVTQQNTAQEGRQNNNCANPNFPGETVDLTGSRSTVACKTVDGSANIHTADISAGTKAEGGDATADLFQQNTAQEGRQNNNCANPNNLTLTTTNSRTQSQCVAEDRSTNIATINR
ncbi:hypothetical protein [Streptomyces sp. NPDC051776]|uniref:hypothetical protein n=1 Tax=Streptomyces sp. NPDC051776 TaxID=3155414 RepID=UPI003436695C